MIYIQYTYLYISMYNIYKMYVYIYYKIHIPRTCLCIYIQMCIYNIKCNDI